MAEAERPERATVKRADGAETIIAAMAEPGGWNKEKMVYATPYGGGGGAGSGGSGGGGGVLQPAMEMLTFLVKADRQRSAKAATEAGW